MTRKRTSAKKNSRRSRDALEILNRVAKALHARLELRIVPVHKGRPAA